MDILNKEVILKNGFDGVVTAISRNQEGDGLMYLVEWWHDDGKKSTWCVKRDFAIKGE